MKSWKSSLIAPAASIHDAIKKIDETAEQIAIVTDSDGRLLGTVTDGDIRRGLLRGIETTSSVTEIMNRNPVTVGPQDDRSTVLALMKRRMLRRVPIVDAQRRVLGVESIDDLIQASSKDNMVVVMAGGLGTRLAPLTNDLPKPMLDVGGRPILETVLINFIEYGFTNFQLCVNYKAEIIKKYFGDGSRWNVSIGYIHEDQRMGTAGALSLLPKNPTESFVVINGDVLTKVNLGHLLNFHAGHKTPATMCVREHNYQVPYGVLRLDSDHHILTIEEKPSYKYFVNAGIYVLEPSVLSLIPANTFYDMPSLFKKLVESGERPAAFPVHEYWLDVGQPADFERARGDFSAGGK